MICIHPATWWWMEARRVRPSGVSTSEEEVTIAELNLGLLVTKL